MPCPAYTLQHLMKSLEDLRNLPLDVVKQFYMRIGLGVIGLLEGEQLTKYQIRGSFQMHELLSYLCHTVFNKFSDTFCLLKIEIPTERRGKAEKDRG